MEVRDKLVVMIGSGMVGVNAVLDRLVGSTDLFLSLIVFRHTTVVECQTSVTSDWFSPVGELE